MVYEAGEKNQEECEIAERLAAKLGIEVVLPCKMPINEFPSQRNFIGVTAKVLVGLTARWISGKHNHTNV
jgi:hypothetical protein